MNFETGKYSITSVKWDIKLEKRLKSKKYLERYGFKVYSQSDEDGIIEEIFNRIGTTNKKFIEFGVDYGLENNTHYLLLKGWNGLWIEGSSKNFETIKKKFKPIIAKEKLKVLNKFINKDNINDIFIEGGVTGEIDLLSIDIDGNDIYVWDNINVINPRVVCIEYNGKIPPSSDWVQPYNPEFIWDGTDYTGSSLNYINKIAKKKGYTLVGTSVSGVNAFFVRNDLCKFRFHKSNKIEDFYNPARHNLVCKPVGHPSFAYIGDRDSEEFWYQNDRDIQYLDGFSYLETLDDGRSFSWMNSLKSTFLLRNYKENVYKLSLLVHLDNTKIIFNIEDKIFEYNLNAGFNDIELPLSNKKNIWLKIIITTDRLWSPMSTDTRELGVAVISKEVK